MRDRRHASSNVHRRRSALRAFTLLELLIVVAIIAVLTTLLLGAISAAQRRTQVAVCQTMISTIKTALSNYKSDQGYYPRLSLRTDPGVWNSDLVALYAGLRNKATAETGGGQNSPYVKDWKPEYVGLLSASLTTYGLAPGGMFEDANLVNSAIAPLAGTDIEQVNTLNFQKAHKPTTGGGGGASAPLVFLDPWGAPFHYREWASVRSSLKETLMTTGKKSRGPFAVIDTSHPVLDTATDFPHDPEAFDIWSGGPNGSNEYGDPNADDVTSWTNERR